MTSIITAFVLALSANILIYASLSFINADLLPRLLSNVYAHTSDFWRLVIVSAFTISTANYIFSKIYKITDPGNAGMVILISLVLVLVSKSLLLGAGELTWRTVLSVAVLVCSAAWVSYELHRVS